MLHHAPAAGLGAGAGGRAPDAGRRCAGCAPSSRLFRPAAGCPALQEFDAGLKALADRLGPARDWDVFLGGLGAKVAAALPGDRRIAALLKAAEARAPGRLCGAAGGAGRAPASAAWCWPGSALLLQRPWREAAEAEAGPARLDEDLPEFAAALLDKRWHKLCAEGEDIEDALGRGAARGAAGGQAAALRRRALRPALAGQGDPALPERLAALQEELGLANDTAVARGLVASLGGGVPAWAVGAVEGFAVARVAHARDRRRSAPGKT